MLRNDEQARTRLCLDELAEVSRHGPLVVCHEDAAIARGTGKDCGVIEPSQPCRRGGPKSMAGARLITADRIIWFRSASAWKRIAIQRVSGVCFFASASF